MRRRGKMCLMVRSIMEQSKAGKGDSAVYGAGGAGIQFKIRDFLSGLVAKTQGTWVQSLVRELDPTCSH